MKIRPVGTGLFHADGQTDIITLIVYSAILRTHLKTPIPTSSTFITKTNQLILLNVVGLGL